MSVLLPKTKIDTAVGFLDIVVRQLGHPRGIVGRLLLRLLNRVNAEMNQATLDVLALRSTDRLLEIGFGGGYLLAQALRSYHVAFAAGLERSTEAVATAQHRFRDEITQGCIAIHHGDAAALPFADASFSALCSVNTLYFWPTPLPILTEQRRVLGPGGRTVLCYEAAAPGAGRTVHARTYRPTQTDALLTQAGFRDVATTRYLNRSKRAYFCTIGYA